MWPEAEELRRNLTLYFECFQNTRVILDCTEIEIKSPRDLTSCILTYSHYKKTYTAKVLIDETLGGLISSSASRMAEGHMTCTSIKILE